MSNFSTTVPDKVALTNITEVTIAESLRSVADLLRPFNIIVPVTLARYQEDTGEQSISIQRKPTLPYILGRLQTISINTNSVNLAAARRGSTSIVKDNVITKVLSSPISITIQCVFHADNINHILKFTNAYLMSTSIPMVIETEEYKIRAKTILQPSLSYGEKTESNGADTAQRLETVSFDVTIEGWAFIIAQSTPVKEIAVDYTISAPGNINGFIQIGTSTTFQSTVQ